MKAGARRRILTLLLAVLFALRGHPAEGWADGRQYGESGGALGRSAVPGERRCTTAEELVALLRQDSGGVIRMVGDDPFLLEGSTCVSVTRPVTVHTTGDGIQVSDDLTLSGPVTVTGRQCFVVRESAFLGLYEGASVLAESQAGGAATAIRMEGWARLSAEDEVVISAQGEGAVGVRCAQGDIIDLDYGSIVAAGTGARAVTGVEDIRVSYAYLTAEGAGALALACAGSAELRQVTAQGGVEAGVAYTLLCRFSREPTNHIPLKAKAEEIRDKAVVYQDLAHGSRPVERPEQRNVAFFYERPDIPEFSFGTQVKCNVLWEPGGFDISRPGIYTVTARLAPIMETSDMELPPVSLEITVVPKDRVAIYRSMDVDGYQFLECIAPAPGAREVLLWLYDGDGWRNLTAEGLAVYAEQWRPELLPSYWSDAETEWALVSYPFFQVSGLPYDKYYWVTAQVSGGAMEGFSNLYELYTGFQGGGDRTGADRGGAEPPTLPSGREGAALPGAGGGAGTGDGSGDKGEASADAPSPPTPRGPSPVGEDAFPRRSAPAQPEPGAAGDEESAWEALSPPLEWEDETTIAISGRRLAVLAAQGEPIIFIKQGLRILVEAEALAALAVGADELLLVTVERTEEGGYNIRFLHNGAEILLPYELLEQSEAPKAPPAALPEDQPAAGPQSFASVREKPGPANLPLLCGAIALPGAGWLIARRKGLRRKSGRP